ncbi:DUF5679 domain-containing protein [Ktedonospora formicarum]|uniref:DUF5679 domain-containing protein n=1 Tax=Ktedonospora formicarum TaxID=2778364 RepID=A0A8J3I7A0_9CHLR|nr:DUF5679 domain-containing protein [Ktedonospora formicarum]GHO48413.1 hypothetical protein KSX_65760 [Ktedonospora formicarum]
MSKRQVISVDRRQRFWEFFIFGCVFIALFIFWLVIRAGLVISFITGVLAGICLAAAWYHWFWQARTGSTRILTTVSKQPEEPAENLARQEDAVSANPKATSEKAPQKETSAKTILTKAETLPQAASKESEPVLVIPSGGDKTFSEVIPLSNVTLVAPEPGQIPDDDDDDDDEELVPANHEHVEAIVASITKNTEKLHIEAYCVKCHVKRDMHNPRLVRLKNGHPALASRCPICASKLYRIISAKKNSEWMNLGEKNETPSTV